MSSRSPGLSSVPPAARATLARVPSAAAIRLDVAANDPALPAVIGGLITAEPHGSGWSLIVEGPHGSRILHITPSASFASVITRVRAALAEVSIDTPYPAPAPFVSEVPSRQHRTYGS